MRTFLLFSVLLSLAQQLLASHILGAELRYRYIRGNIVQVELLVYRDCQGIAIDPSLSISAVSTCGNGSFTGTLQLSGGTALSQTLGCNGPTQCEGGMEPGVELYRYQGFVPLDSSRCPQWTLSFQNCCRSFALNNLQQPGQQEFYLSALLDIRQANQSPQFNLGTLWQACQGQLLQRSHAATDADGDSLVYQLLGPAGANGQALAFVAGASAAQPFFTPANANLNAQTGFLTATPSTVQLSSYVVQVSEYRQGQLIGRIQREMVLRVLNCGTGSINEYEAQWQGNTGPFFGCAGNAYNQIFQVSDADAGARLQYNLLRQPQGSNLSAVGQGTANLQFQLSGSYAALDSFCVEILDEQGCPRRRSTRCFSFGAVSVGLTSNQPQVCTATLPATVGLFAQGWPAGGTYQWTGNVGLSAIQDSLAQASLSQTTNYQVQYQYSGCTANAQTTVELAAQPLSVQLQVLRNATCLGDTVEVLARHSGGFASYQVFAGYDLTTAAPLARPVGGTLLNLGNDGYSTALPIGFDFYFFNQVYQQIYISANGYLSFSPNSASGGVAGQRIPNVASPNNLIALAWENLDPSAGGQIRYLLQGTAPNRELVVLFENVPFFNELNNRVTGQIVLKEGSNVIQISSELINPAGYHRLTQGIENADGTWAFTPQGRNQAPWASVSYNVVFTPRFRSGASYRWSIAGGDTVQRFPLTAPLRLRVWASQGSCVVSDSLDLVPMSGLVLRDSVVQGLCHGEVHLSLSGGAAPLQYQWSTGSTVLSQLALPLGLHGLTITDANGCRLFRNFSIQANASLQANSSPAVCGTASGSLTALVGPTSPANLSFAWSNGQTGSTISGLASAWYSVTATDLGRNCQVHRNFFVGQDSSCFSRIRGRVWLDPNQGCNIGFWFPLQQPLALQLSNGQVAYTDANGFFEFQVNQTGTYTVQFLNQAYPHIAAHCLPSPMNITQLGQQFNQADVYLHQTLPGSDIGLMGSDFTTARVGMNYVVQLSLANNSFQSPRLDLIYEYDPRLLFALTNVANYSVDPVAGRITFPNLTLDAFSLRGLQVVFLIDSSLLGIGDTLQHRLSYQAAFTDPIPGNDIYTWSSPVRNSYDPNDKQVFPHRGGDSKTGGQVYIQDGYLHYLIRFQNTGNDVAYDVVLEDSLALGGLDVRGLQVVGSTHPGYRLYLLDSLRFRMVFQQINLPDSASDPLGSIGAVAFRIPLRQGLALGTVIPNRAAIYFDYNPPIMTNTVYSTLATAPVSVEALASPQLSLFPNPVQDRVLLSWSSDLGLEGLRLVDVLGREQWQMQLSEGMTEQVLDWTNLPAGHYWLYWQGRAKQGFLSIQKR